MRGETDNIINHSKQLYKSLLDDCYTPLSKFKDSQAKLKKQVIRMNISDLTELVSSRCLESE